MLCDCREDRRQIEGEGCLRSCTPVYDILPDQHAEPVAVIIPAHRFDLDVLAEHVHAGGFHLRYVIDEGFVGSGRVKPVWPVPLIEDAIHKIRSVIEEDSCDSVFVRLEGHFAHAKVGDDCVVPRSHFYRIEPGFFRTPGHNVRDIYTQLFKWNSGGFHKRIREDSGSRNAVGIVLFCWLGDKNFYRDSG